MTSMGTYEELLNSSPSFAQLLEDIHQHEQEQKTNALPTQRSMIGSTSSEEDDGEETNAAPTNIETKTARNCAVACVSGLPASWCRPGPWVCIDFGDLYRPTACIRVQ